MFDNFKNICAASCGVCARAAADCSAEGLTHSALLPAACWLGASRSGWTAGSAGSAAPCLPAVFLLAVFYFEPYFILTDRRTFGHTTS